MAQLSPDGLFYVLPDGTTVPNPEFQAQPAAPVVPPPEAPVVQVPTEQELIAPPEPEIVDPGGAITSPFDGVVPQAAPGPNMNFSEAYPELAQPAGPAQQPVRQPSITDMPTGIPAYSPVRDVALTENQKVEAASASAAEAPPEIVDRGLAGRPIPGSTAQAAPTADLAGSTKSPVLTSQERERLAVEQAESELRHKLITDPESVAGEFVSTGDPDIDRVYRDGAILEMREGALAADSAERKAQFLQEQQQKALETKAERDAYVERYMSDTQAKIEEIENKEIDPGRFWSSRSTSQKIAGMLSIFTSGVLQAQGVAGADTPIKLINQAIDRDMQAQMADRKRDLAMLNERQELGQFRISEFDQERLDNAQFRVQGLAVIEQELAAKLGTMQPGKVKNNTEKLLLQIRQKREAEQAKLGLDAMNAATKAAKLKGRSGSSGSGRGGYGSPRGAGDYVSKNKGRVPLVRAGDQKTIENIYGKDRKHRVSTTDKTPVRLLLRDPKGGVIATNVMYAPSATEQVKAQKFASFAPVAIRNLQELKHLINTNGLATDRGLTKRADALIAQFFQAKGALGVTEALSKEEASYFFGALGLPAATSKDQLEKFFMDAATGQNSYDPEVGVRNIRDKMKTAMLGVLDLGDKSPYELVDIEFDIAPEAGFETAKAQELDPSVAGEYGTATEVARAKEEKLRKTVADQNPGKDLRKVEATAVARIERILEDNREGFEVVGHGAAKDTPAVRRTEAMIDFLRNNSPELIQLSLGEKAASYRDDILKKYETFQAISKRLREGRTPNAAEAFREMGRTSKQLVDDLKRFEKQASAGKGEAGKRKQSVDPKAVFGELLKSVK